MSESAFGVEHGDVFKAFGAPKPPKMAPNPSKAFASAKKATIGARQGMKNANNHFQGGVRQMGSAAGGAFQGAGGATQRAGQRAGGALQGAGGAMKNNSFKTGAAILGGGGALTGGLYANRSKAQGPKKPGVPGAK